MATALETASLVMVPSGYEDGTLGSLQPLDGTGDFTFTRGSNISATRVNEDGYIEKGYENLLLRSNTFDTTWASVRVSESTGFAGYDGADNAWKIVPNTQLGDHRLDQSTSVSGVWTFNIYAKAAGYNFLYILFSGIGNSGKVIDISPNQGVVVDNKGGVQAIDESITDVGNNWWKITLTYSGTLGTLRIITLPANDTSSYAGDGTSGILIQDAQVNQGLVAYPYLETTTTTAKGGILEDMPRLDYSSGRCSLLLEPSRTNKVLNSEYLDGYQEYYKSAVTNTGNTIEAPDGGRVPLYNIGNGYIFFLSTTTGTASSFSFYAKSDTDGYQISYRNPDGTNTTTALSNTEWKRITAIGVHTNANLMLHDNRILGSTGNVAFWGVQLEEGAYPTSYMPTYGVSQTRLEDDCIVSNVASLIGQNEGSYFIEWTHQLSDETYSISGLDSGGNNRMHIQLNSGGGANSKIGFFYRVNGVVLYSNANTQSLVVGTNYKCAITYTQTSFIVYLNGIQIVNETGYSASGGVFNNISFAYSNYSFSQPIKQTLVFPTALSDEACIELTTI